HRARVVSGRRDRRRGALPAAHAARGADGAARAGGAAAGGRTAGAVPRVGRVGLYDRADHLPRWWAGVVAGERHDARRAQRIMLERLIMKCLTPPLGFDARLRT